MQRVETDTASRGVIDRVGPQMIDIDCQPGQHYQISGYPFRPIPYQGHPQRYNKMKRNMNDNMLLNNFFKKMTNSVSHVDELICKARGGEAVLRIPRTLR